MREFEKKCIGNISSSSIYSDAEREASTSGEVAAPRKAMFCFSPNR